MKAELAGKVNNRRKIPGNYTFVIVADLDDFDTQIYKNVADTGTLTDIKQRHLTQQQAAIVGILDGRETRPGSYDGRANRLVPSITTTAKNS